MNNNVVVLTSVAAMNVDSYNRSFKSSTDVQNGTIIKCGALSAIEGESEVFTAELASATDTGLYMAYTAEDSIIEINGQQYKFGLIDPRLYTNVANKVFSGFKLIEGDRITISADAIEGSGEAYVVVDADGKLKYSASVPAEGLYFNAIQNTYLSLAGAGLGTIGGTQRLAAVELEVAGYVK